LPFQKCQSDDDCPRAEWCELRVHVCVRFEQPCADLGADASCGEDAGRAEADAGGEGEDGGRAEADAGKEGEDAGRNESDGGRSAADAGIVLLGHRILYYRVLPDDLAVPEPDPASITTALIPLEDGGFIHAPITNLDGGWFQVKKPAEGEVYLQIGQLLVITSGHTISLDSYSLGRPGQTVPASYQDIPVGLSASGMEPTAAPYLYLVTPNTGFTGIVNLVTPLTAPVGTIIGQRAVVQSAVIPPDGLLPFLVGDSTYVHQYAYLDAGSLAHAFPGSEVSYGATVRTAEVHGLQLTEDGGTLSVTFPSPALTSLSVGIKASEWSSHAADLADGGCVPYSFDLGVYPVPSSEGLADVFLYTPALVDLWTTSAPSTDIDASFLYADGLPASWARQLAVSYGCTMAVKLAGSTSAARILIWVADSRPLPSGAGRVSPRVTAPEWIRVDGLAGKSGGGLTTTTPVISWAPAPGPGAFGYMLSVFQFSVVQSRTVKTPILRATTSRTSMRIPPGVLVSGGSYIFRLEASLSPGHDFAAEPFVADQAIDIAYADVASGVWQAP